MDRREGSETYYYTFDALFAAACRRYWDKSIRIDHILIPGIHTETPITKWYRGCEVHATRVGTEDIEGSMFTKYTLYYMEVYEDVPLDKQAGISYSKYDTTVSARPGSVPQKEKTFRGWLDWWLN